ncbi:MAG TPA: M28 family metallopeptidase [Planctomycetota bacterium]|nr:M28 family metallopeptidase [Planctomycetota bacterium]
MPEPLDPASFPRAPADLGARALAHVATVVGFGERHPGSPGARRQVEYIERELRSYGLAVEVDRWVDPGEGIEFANVIGTLPGKSSERIVLGCHHDTKVCSGHPRQEHNFPFVGANDGGSGVGLLLALAQTLATGPRPTATLQFVFFDGEESLEFKWNLARALFGSRRFVARERAPGSGRHWREPIRAMLLLDMVGARDLQLDDDANSTPALKGILRAAAHATGNPHLALTEPNTVTDDHLPFLDAGIPAAVLIDLANNPQWHTPDDTLEHVAADSLQRVGAIVLAALPEIERRFVKERR